MDMLSFATGLAIGKKKYGGGGNSIFQDILRYSTQVNTIPIDSTYKWTLNFWYTDRLEFQHAAFGPGYVSYDNVGGEDGTVSSVFPIYKRVYLCKIAWENNVPLFAICTAGGITILDEYAKIPVGTTDNFEYYYYKNKEYVVQNGAYTSFGGVSLVVSASSSSPMYFNYSSTATATMTVNIYGYRQPTMSDIPEVYLMGSGGGPAELSGNTLLLPTSDDNTFSDMSTAEVYEKWQKMYVAALIANDINAREAIIVQPT